MNSTREKICVGNGRLFYFSGDGKIYLYYILKRRYPVIKKKPSVIFIECTRINWKHKYADSLCVSILLNNMVWHLVVIGNNQNNESLIYIFTGKIQNGTPIIFIKTMYHCWYK